MAKLVLCAVYDLKARAYNPPFGSPTVGVALRGFAGACRQPDSPFAEFPGDYALHQVGEFDTALGTVTSLQAPLPLATAVEYVEVKGGKTWPEAVASADGGSGRLKDVARSI